MDNDSASAGSERSRFGSLARRILWLITRGLPLFVVPGLALGGWWYWATNIRGLSPGSVTTIGFWEEAGVAFAVVGFLVITIWGGWIFRLWIGELLDGTQHIREGYQLQMNSSANKTAHALVWGWRFIRPDAFAVIGAGGLALLTMVNSQPAGTIFWEEPAWPIYTPTYDVTLIGPIAFVLVLNYLVGVAIFYLPVRLLSVLLRIFTMIFTPIQDGSGLIPFMRWIRADIGRITTFIAVVTVTSVAPPNPFAAFIWPGVVIGSFTFGALEINLGAVGANPLYPTAIAISCAVWYLVAATIVNILRSQRTGKIHRHDTRYSTDGRNSWSFL